MADLVSLTAPAGKKDSAFMSVLVISARNVFTGEENKTEWLSLLSLCRCKFRILDNSSTYVR